MELKPDLSFQIKPVAFAIAGLISVETSNRPDFSTFPWYNGRERGICLVVSKSYLDDIVTFISFGECRNSDSIYVDIWKGPHPCDCPTVVRHYTDEAYNNRKTFSSIKIHDAARYIENEILKQLGV